MAHKEQEQLTPKQQVLRDLDEARATLAWNALYVAEAWNPRTFIAQSMEKNRLLWIGGAVIAGIATLRFLTFSNLAKNNGDNSNSPAKNNRIFGFILAPLVAFGRKAVLKRAAQYFESFLHQKVSPIATTNDRV